MNNKAEKILNNLLDLYKKDSQNKDLCFLLDTLDCKSTNSLKIIDIFKTYPVVETHMNNDKYKKNEMKDLKKFLSKYALNDYFKVSFHETEIRPTYIEITWNGDLIIDNLLRVLK